MATACRPTLGASLFDEGPAATAVIVTVLEVNPERD